MAEKRQHQRVRCDSKCILYYAHTKYSGVISNISLSGAAVRLYGLRTGAMQAGDTCSLLLCADPELCSYKYSGRITRITPAGIGLEFIEMRA